MKYEVIVGVVSMLLACLRHSSTVLTGSGSIADIASLREFGCQWLGGNDAGIACNCLPSAQEFLIEKGTIASYSLVKIKISGCEKVRFAPNAISNMRNLRHIELSHIQYLHFEESSLVWDGYVAVQDYYSTVQRNFPALKILIDNSTIQQISSYAFKGTFKELILRSVTIKNIDAFGFSSMLHLQSMGFLNTHFENLQSQAFKKCNIENLLIDSCSFTKMPSRTFSDILVYNIFSIKNTTFGVIKSSAFFINNPKRFEFYDSSVGVLEGEAFKVSMLGNVFIKHSIFNKTQNWAFRGFSLNMEEVTSTKDIIFDSLTFNKVDGNFLTINTTSFSASVNNVLLNRTCECSYADYILQATNFGDSFICLWNEGRLSLKEFKNSNCLQVSANTAIYIILGITVALFIIIFSVLVIYFKCLRNNKQTECLTDDYGKSVGLIVPDGRTYRETELHVIVERADLLTTDL